ADLGASQGKYAWRRLGIDPMGIAEEPPGPDGKFQRGKGLIFDTAEEGPMLTVAMAARLQGFPAGWQFHGGKTSAYRQVGNAFPPPVARVLGEAIRKALEGGVARCCAAFGWPGCAQGTLAGSRPGRPR